MYRQPVLLLVTCMYTDLVMEHPRQVIEGDILVNKFTIQLMGLSDDRGQVQNQLPPDENRKKKASMSEVLKRKFSWPNCVIPFAFASYVGKKTFQSLTH